MFRWPNPNEIWVFCLSHPRDTNTEPFAPGPPPGPPIPSAPRNTLPSLRGSGRYPSVDPVPPRPGPPPVGGRTAFSARGRKWLPLVLARSQQEFLRCSPRRRSRPHSRAAFPAGRTARKPRVGWQRRARTEGAGITESSRFRPRSALAEISLVPALTSEPDTAQFGSPRSFTSLRPGPPPRTAPRKNCGGRWRGPRSSPPTVSEIAHKRRKGD